MSLKGKHALVTGGASGIGQATVVQLLAQRASVTVADIADYSAQAKELGIGFVQADLSQTSEVDALIARLAEAGNIDILVNCAAIQPLNVPLTETGLDLLEQVYQTNYRSVFQLIARAPDYFNPGGRIINLASWLGHTGVPGMSAYGPFKAALIQLTRIAALELAPRGITVNALCPGLVMTPAHAPESEALVASIAPLGRAGTAEEIAGWIAFLASETAGYMTGQTLTIDGGLSAGYGVQTLGHITQNLMAAAE